MKLYEEWLFGKKRNIIEETLVPIEEKDFNEHLQNLKNIKKKYNLFVEKYRLSKFGETSVYYKKMCKCLLDGAIEVGRLYTINDKLDNNSKKIIKRELDAQVRVILSIIVNNLFGNRKYIENSMTIINYISKEYHIDEYELYFYKHDIYFYKQGNVYGIRNRVEDKKNREKHIEDDPFSEEVWNQ